MLHVDAWPLTLLSPPRIARPVQGPSEGFHRLFTITPLMML